MTAQDIVLTGVYASTLAEAAVWVDAGGGRQDIRAVPEDDPLRQVFSGDNGVRGLRRGFRVRVSELPDPCTPACIEHGGRRHEVDKAVPLNDGEWFIYVTA